MMEMLKLIRKTFYAASGNFSQYRAETMIGTSNIPLMCFAQSKIHIRPINDAVPLAYFHVFSFQLAH